VSTIVCVMLSTDPADLFCQLFDRLSDFDVASDLRWREIDELGALTRAVRARARELALEAGWLESAVMEASRGSGEGLPAGTWAAARGLQQALVAGNPDAFGRSHVGAGHPLARLVNLRYDMTGRFDSGDERIGGALLPQLAGGARSGVTTVSRGEAFPGVHRVTPDIWNCPDVEFAPVLTKGAPLRLPSDPHGALVVACVPMLEALNEDISLSQVTRDRGSFFSAQIDDATLKQRVGVVLRRLDESGAMLGVAPELSLSEDVLEAWRQAIKGNRRPRHGALQWVFVGSGPLGGTDVQPPYNCGVMINRETGQEVHRQEKLFPFTLKPKQIEEWCLTEVFTAEVEEEMTRGRALRIVETTWGRVAVLICEDLTKVLDERVGRLVRGFGVSLIIAPVFSKEVEPHRWEHQQAQTYAEQAGARTVVANSLVIARQKGKQGAVGTCLANAPEGKFKLGTCGGAEEVSVFRLTAHDVKLDA
jgi:predicted amidohydrolase